MRVAIFVRYGSHATGVGGTHDSSLVVRVRERPIEGKATEAALRALASALGIRRRDVALVSGRTSRVKVVEIPDAASARFLELHDAGES